MPITEDFLGPTFSIRKKEKRHCPFLNAQLAIGAICFRLSLALAAKSGTWALGASQTSFFPWPPHHTFSPFLSWSSPTPHWPPRLSVFSPVTWACGQGRRGTIPVKTYRKGHPVLCLVCSLWLPTSHFPTQVQGQRNKSEFQDSWGRCR